MKKFWKKTEGFTLVELIVVIAILSILAGVGTVGYSGYIKKANMAADETQLSALNTAYAAACIESGKDATETAAKNITIGNDKEITKADIIVTNPAAKATDIQNAFGNYYNGGTFKVITNLIFANGKFIDSNSTENLVFYYGEYPINITAKDLAALSTDNAFKSMGASGLLSNMDKLKDVLFNADGTAVFNKVDEVLQTNSFLEAAGAYLGMDPSADYGDATYLDAVKYTLEQEDCKQEALIVYAAGNAANLTDDQISSLFASDNIYNAMKQGDQETVMGQAAVAYGMYVSYLEYCEQEEIALSNDKFVNVAQTTEFKNYVNSENAKNDQAAFLAAMNVIGSNSDESELTKDILENGYNNDTLKELLDSLLDG